MTSRCFASDPTRASVKTLKQYCSCYLCFFSSSFIFFEKNIDLVFLNRFNVLVCRIKFKKKIQYIY